MKIIRSAQAGTFESSDILILVEPGSGARHVELDSTVLLQYEQAILSEIHSTLDDFHVEDIRLVAKDKGALNPTIRARVQTALLRAASEQRGTSYASE